MLGEQWSEGVENLCVSVGQITLQSVLGTRVGLTFSQRTRIFSPVPCQIGISQLGIMPVPLFEQCVIDG